MEYFFPPDCHIKRWTIGNIEFLDRQPKRDDRQGANFVRFSYKDTSLRVCANLHLRLFMLLGELI